MRREYAGSAKPEEWPAVLARITLALPFPTILEAERQPLRDGWVIKLRGQVPDRDTRRPIWVHIHEHVESALVMPEFWPIETIRRLVRTMMLHELDEGFYVDGHLLSDPHKNDPPRIAVLDEG